MTGMSKITSRMGECFSIFLSKFPAEQVLFTFFLSTPISTYGIWEFIRRNLTPAVRLKLNSNFISSASYVRGLSSLIKESRLDFDQSKRDTKNMKVGAGHFEKRQEARDCTILSSGISSIPSTACCEIKEVTCDDNGRVVQM